MSYVNITKENFQELVLNSTKTVLLDFWAVWCGPCRMVAPIVEEIANERDDLVVGKINVDEEMALAAQFGIVSIPTIKVLRGGKVTGSLVGLRAKAELEALIK